MTGERTPMPTFHGFDVGGENACLERHGARHDDGRFDKLHGWIVANLPGALSLPRLADRAEVSERSFSRTYLEATGQTPARAVETLRVEAARSQLLDSQIPVKRIAQRCGFGS